MLYIATDIGEKNWLIYIMEEFRRINRADFDIRIIPLEQIDPVESGHIIYYTEQYLKAPAIINRSDVEPHPDLERIGDNIMIIKESFTNDERFDCQYDLFWNSFVFLSRLEEYISESAGHAIHSYSFRHRRRDKKTFKIPVVNNLFNELEKIIARNFPGLSFGKKEKPHIELSHDVDYIRKTLQVRMKRALLNLAGAIISIRNPKVFVKKLSKAIVFPFSNPDYWGFDYWEALEIEKKSIFYIYAGSGKKSLKTWLIDPTYDVRNNPRMKETLRRLLDNGFQLGLHGSYESARDEKLLRLEKEILEECIGIEVTRVRQHYLEYHEMITPYLHNKHFKIDSTLGWVDIIGFRSGCASLYRPYDHRKRRAFEFLELPLVIGDSNIFDYCGGDFSCVARESIELLQKLTEYKSAHVCLSWHQNTCNSDYEWNELLEKLFAVIRDLV